ncbi:MAG TPA: aconitate hydratase AcnA [Tepidisphaeraceae bacterium]|nr:aconitate hydratase AcnA [Tepidisphaeraceae bacterium]
MANKIDPFGASATISTKAGDVRISRLDALERAGLADLDKLPFSIKVLLESTLRNLDNFEVSEQDVTRLGKWNAPKPNSNEVPFKVARVILQDFTGVPCVVDLAAMRAAMKRAGGDPQKINPLVPVDLVIDHSVQVDEFGSQFALLNNVQREFERNRERYEFLKWGQKAFKNFDVVPPATGIVHQVNLEYLAKVVQVRDGVAFPDSLVGTDSHTTMINGLGVVGWGVGGIEAEACMLGQPIYLVTPEVVGFRLFGKLPEGATATDLVLAVTQILRAHGVVEKFVEFYGEGLSSMSVADRATIANMAPEYGATIGFFPVDEQTLAYLRLTGRPGAHIDLVERYCKEQGLWREKDSAPTFTQVLELDLASVVPSLAGPKRPQDRVELPSVRPTFRKAFADALKPVAGGAGSAGTGGRTGGQGESLVGGQSSLKPHAAQAGGGTAVADAAADGQLQHGDVVIAAITSCTNTSNPSVMIAAGLLAKKAVEKGLQSKPHVKTSLSPGSRVVTDYFNKANLQTYLDQLGFQTTGYGCMTCIGNSGPLPEHIAAEVDAKDLVAVSVLSGNRNFEGRINPHVKANYLASPPLVVAYALAGTVEIDLTTEPLGTDKKGKPVMLADIWPSQDEVNQTIASCISPDMFQAQYDNVGEKNPEWNAIPVRGGELFEFSDASTYVQEPPFFIDLQPEPAPVRPISGARVLVMVGDSVTTDHISPAGSIKKTSPAGQYLMEHGVQPVDFNSYGSRRGNDRVMTRGTFANIRLRNLLAPGTEGGVTAWLGVKPLPHQRPEQAVHASDDPRVGEIMSIFDASQDYQKAGIPLIVLAGKDYGMGSSRDWAAKGVYLLGIKAVIAESFERIHRSNLVGMGVLPLQFKKGHSRQSLGLTGTGMFDVQIPETIRPQQDIHVIARYADGPTIEFDVVCRIDTPVEVEYYRNGGILHTVLRRMLKGAR